ncbi:hypothetical protein B0H14DRAFT_2614879 [Mycena olivaceomarginata]|nr:hypothetical protein B0H14DRAFT_2614879 [Mycena olivaceomarginata]
MSCSQFFALRTTLPERQSFYALAKLIGLQSQSSWSSTKRGVSWVQRIVKYLGTTEWVHEGLVDIFKKKGWKILTPHRGWERGEIQSDDSEEGRCTNPNQRWRYDGYRTDEDTDVVRTIVETIGLGGADGDLNLVASLRACFLQSDARENGDPNRGSLDV